MAEIYASAIRRLQPFRGKFWREQEFHAKQFKPLCLWTPFTAAVLGSVPGWSARKSELVAALHSAYSRIAAEFWPSLGTAGWIATRVPTARVGVTRGLLQFIQFILSSSS